jgi:hypothetical protein
MTSSLRCLALTGALVLGCAAKPPPVKGPADAVRVEKEPPVAGARALGSLRATDGQGCGLFGTLGSYEGALAKLREQAYKLGADYVQITSVTEPHPDHECVQKEYKLTGVAYRSTPPAPKPAAAPPVTSSAAASAPVTPCVTRMLEFSARGSEAATLGVWIDQPKTSAEPSGLELKCAPGSERVELVRNPGGEVVAVSSGALRLGTDWHTWRLQRTSDRLSVWLDEKLIVLYAVPAPAESADFALDATGVELRGVRQGCAAE